MIVLLDSPEKLQLYMKQVPDVALSLINQVTSPLTIIYPSATGLAKNVLASDGSVGIRITRDPFCMELCKTMDKPLISTSANISGYDYPVIFREMDPELIKKADYVVEYGKNEIRQIKPSTIIKLKNNWEYDILRS
jgi:L-threonylcarbamoyladenylate synthase